MRIGQDVSMQVNIAEGYMIMEYKARDLVKHGKFQPDCECRFIQHFPDYVKSELGWRPGDPSLAVDIELSANDLWGMYTQDVEIYEGINSFIGESHNFPLSEYMLLQLASDINSYVGLDQETVIYT